MVSIARCGASPTNGPSGHPNQLEGSSINLLPGAVLILALWYGMDPKPMRLARLRTGDWLGILAMAVGVGSLVVVLEEGQRKDWFGSDLIVGLTVLAVVFITSFIDRKSNRMNSSH